MKIYISANDGVPIYHQIVTQVKHLVAAGRLKPGQELPPIRLLAQQLLINPNTVARAYRELEAAGIVSSRRGAGTHVSDEGSPLARKERLKILNDRIDALLRPDIIAGGEPVAGIVANADLLHTVQP